MVLLALNDRITNPHAHVPRRRAANTQPPLALLVLVALVVLCCSVEGGNKVNCGGGVPDDFGHDALPPTKVTHLRSWLNDPDNPHAKYIQICKKHHTPLWDCIYRISLVSAAEPPVEAGKPCLQHSDCEGEGELCCNDSTAHGGWSSCLPLTQCGITRARMDRESILSLASATSHSTLDKKDKTALEEGVKVLQSWTDVTTESFAAGGSAPSPSPWGRPGLRKGPTSLQSRLACLAESVRAAAAVTAASYHDHDSFSVYDGSAADAVAAGPHDQGACGNCYAFAIMTAVSQQLYSRTIEKHSGFEWGAALNTFLSPQRLAEDYYRISKSNSGGNLSQAMKVLALSDTTPDFCVRYTCHNHRTVEVPDSMIPPECRAVKLPGLSTLRPYQDFPSVQYTFDSVTKDVMRRMKEGKSIVVTVRYWSGLSDGVEADGSVTVEAVTVGDRQSEGGYYSEDGDVLLPLRFQGHRTNHAVVLIGWGEQDSVLNPGQKVKYWLLQNSHGDTFSRSHTFKVYRGASDCSVYDKDKAGGCPIDLLLAAGSTPREVSDTSNMMCPIVDTGGLIAYNQVVKNCHEKVTCHNNGIVVQNDKGCACLCPDGYVGASCSAPAVEAYTSGECAGMVTIKLRRDTSVGVQIVGPTGTTIVSLEKVLFTAADGVWVVEFPNKEVGAALASAHSHGGLRAFVTWSWTDVDADDKIMDLNSTEEWPVAVVSDGSACQEMIGQQ